MDVSGGLTLVETVRKTLGSPIWTKIESMWGLESELDKLKDTILTIEAVLLDADEEDIHQQQHRSHVVRNRLQRLREALYRADDLIDEIATLAHRNKLISGNKVRRELCVFFSSSNQLYCAYIWSKEMKKIREMLDEIIKDHQHELGQRMPVTHEPWPMVRHHPRETHSYCDEGGIIGREDDKKKLIGMLLGSTSVEKNVSVISIVGIGGLGKTSLAQSVYNDATIQTEFPLRMWVCVSVDFNVGALLHQIIAAARNDAKELNMPSMDRLQSSLGEVLNGKKYLLVLDDIWNEDRFKWDELSVLLEKGGSGSKIIVTTRSIRVANIVGSHKIHELEGLSKDDSRKLFERIAFEGENNPKYDKEILCKCRNVPLAIRVVGSLLRGQDTRTWEYIKNTDLVNIKQDDDGIIPVLKLRYMPRDLSKLVNLRNLDIFGCTKLRYMPPGMNKMTSLHKLTGFVMSDTRKTSQWRSHCVGELVDLVNFTNHADILQILVRKFVSYDAFEANICRNLLSKHLREIEINWKDDNDDDDDSEENNNAKVSLKGLESCHNLSKIHLQGILRLEHLPPLHQLRQLKFLTLDGLRNLKYVDKYNISEDGAKTEELVFFPSLEKLKLKNLPNFKGWWKTTSESNSGKVDTETSNGDKKQKEEAQYNQLTTTGTHFNSYLFPRLSCLKVNQCPSLTAIPWGPNLEKMTMRIFDLRMTVCSVSIDYYVGSLNYEFRHFYQLEINSDYTKSLPRGMEFPSDFLPRGIMMVFPSDCLCSLRSLVIISCSKLKRLSWEGFWEHCTALEALVLIDLEVLMLEDEDEEEEVKSSNRDGDEGEIRKEVAPWRFLSHSLHNLTLDVLPKLEKLPNGMRHLTSLQSLEIRYCKNLKSMSEAMRHLTSLQQLTLSYNSMELNERCKKPNGADWPNIQHITWIDIKGYDLADKLFSITYENQIAGKAPASRYIPSCY